MPWIQFLNSGKAASFLYLVHNMTICKQNPTQIFWNHDYEQKYNTLGKQVFSISAFKYLLLFPYLQKI